ncbi:MAG: tRNA pseudouridine(55) synthase TruB [Syntrophobacterales bacterium]|nr:tRNA pseudouridine(55) synthase TruB [Syntrophobacterales bacterium]
MHILNIKLRFQRMNGVVVIDKPSGMTSHDVVARVRRISGISKVGHTGTLDPLATGVLPVCLNEATKLVQFLANDGKEYRATLLLGVRTDTLDTEGSVLSREVPLVSREQVETVLKNFIGKLKQTVPRYSAVKVKGRALYDWTRRGIDVEPPEREVEIYDVRINEFSLPEVVFTVSCSKGTYIRSLCAEAGEALGCGGCMSGLRRTRSGMFNLDSAIALDGLLQEEGWAQAATKLTPLVELLPEFPLIEVDRPLAEKLKNGYQPTGEVLLRYHIPFLAEGDVVKLVTDESRLVAVARMLCSSEELFSDRLKIQAVKILRVFDD